MAQVYNRLTLDVKKKNHDIITAVQHDANSRYLDINLIDNGVNINLTGHEVRLYARKPDQTEVYNDGEITNAAQGRVQIELTSQLLAKEGYVEAQVITYKNNKQILSTLPFKIHVVSNLMSDNAIESSNEYGALVILYQNLYEAYDLMTTMVQRIGTPGTVAQQLNLNTMFKVWDWLIQYLRDNSSAGVMDSLTSLHTKSDNIKNETAEIKAKVTTLQAKTNTAEEPLNYFLWMADLSSNGTNGYVYNNKEIINDMLENSKLWINSPSMFTYILNEKGKMELEFSNRIGKKIVDFSDFKKGAFQSLVGNVQFFASAQMLKSFLMNDKFVQGMFVDKNISNYLSQHNNGGLCEVLGDAVNEKPDILKKIYSYRYSDSDQWHISGLMHKYTTQSALKLINAIKRHSNKFRKKMSGYLSLNSYDYYDFGSIRSQLTGSDTEKLKKYIVFIRIDPNQSIRPTVYQNDKLSQYYQIETLNRQNSGVENNPIANGQANIYVTSVFGKVSLSSGESKYKVWYEVYEML